MDFGNAEMLLPLSVMKQDNSHLTRPSVSHRLRILKEANIVAMRTVGTKNYYYLSADETRWKEITDLLNLIYESVNLTIREKTNYDIIFFRDRKQRVCSKKNQQRSRGRVYQPF